MKNQSPVINGTSGNRWCVSCVLALALVGLPASSRGAKPVSAEKTSFQEVTSQLDAGGSFYLYLSTEQLLEGLSDKVSGWRNVAAAIPNVPPDGQKVINAGFDIVTHLIKTSGLEDISGVGMSSIAVEKGFYHGKMLVHHYKGKGSGMLWTMFGQKAHALDGLSLLPANTVLASFSDLDLAALWSVIQKEAARSGFPEAEQFLNKLPDGFQQATGLEWSKVLGSLGGEYGLVVTLDESKKISLPMPGNELQIPEPGMLLVLKVKDDAIFNRVAEALKQTGMEVVAVDKPNLKMRTLSVPLPLPITLRPTIARSGDYLFVATTDALIQEALAVQAGDKPGLKASPEFLHLAKDVPQQGNQFSFVSPRLGETITRVQERALDSAGKLEGGAAQAIRSLLNANNANFAYSVSGNTDEGWLVVSNGSQHPAKVVLAYTVVVPAAIIAAVALPAIAKAHQH